MNFFKINDKIKRKNFKNNKNNENNINLFIYKRQFLILLNIIYMNKYDIAFLKINFINLL